MKISRTAYDRAKADLLAAMMRLAGCTCVARIYDRSDRSWIIRAVATDRQLAAFASDEAKYEQGK